MDNRDHLLTFPLAIMIVMALLGIVLVGMSGGNVSTSGNHGQNLGSAGAYTSNPISNIATNGMEPLGGGIINTSTGQPDNNGETVLPQSFALNNFEIIAIALGAAILAAIAVATIAGFNVFSSGLNAGVSSILFQYATLAAIWLVLSVAAQSIFFGSTPLGIGLIFYTILTIAYLVGTVNHIHGASG